MTESLAREFADRFNRDPQVMVRAPGRVNLIGEHTDYNEGFVFPAAIDRSITIVSAPREDRTIRAYSRDFEQESTFQIDEPIRKSGDAPWSNYIRGVTVQYLKRGLNLRGMDLQVQGDVPIGAGLSSSAALEIATAETCRVINRINITRPEMALLGQAAEREFVGVQCGIMDQFVSTLARSDSALFLDCRDLSYSVVPIDFDARIVVCDSRVQRTLDSSSYNRRREECEEAVHRLSRHLGPVWALRDVSPEDLRAFGHLLPDTILKRARHVISENARVLDAVKALETADLETFGKLLFESHRSLRDDYEVSCRELDILVKLASGQEGIIGARMTGAGFGGCTVNLLRSSCVDSFCREVEKGYRREAGIEVHTYVCRPSDGVSSTRI